MYLQYTLFFIFYFLFIYQKCTDFHGTLKWVLDCIDPDHQLFYTHTNIFRSRTIFTYQKFPTTVSTSPHSQLWTHSNRSKLYMYLLANLRISSLFISSLLLFASASKMCGGLVLPLLCELKKTHNLKR